PRLLVDDEDVGLRMVDLDDVQRTRDLKRSGNGRRRLYGLLFATLLCPLLEVDVLKAGQYRSAMRWPETCRNAVRVYVPNELRNSRTVPVQVMRLDRRTDDLLPLPVQRTMPLWPSSL